MFCRLISKVKNNIIKRCLLTQAYPCTALWNEKLNGVDCLVSANDLSIQLQAKLNADTPISALDFDILMNKTNEMDLRNLSFIIKLIKDFRKTQEATKVFESSSHGIIRNLIDMDEAFQAYFLIRNREKTGVFLDQITVNLLINKFLIDKNWENAFYVSAEWILQECLEESRLGISMCLISCLNFWIESLWKYKPPVADVSKLPVEYVFMRYLKPECFDDHFDLCHDNYRRRLLGKCFSELSTHLHVIGQPQELDQLNYFRNNLGLVGLALHEKLDHLLSFMERWLQEDDVKLNETLISTVGDLITTSERHSDTDDCRHPTHSEDEIATALLKFQNLADKFRSKELIDSQDLFSSALHFTSNKIEGLCDSETEKVADTYKQFASHRLAVLEKAKLHLKNREILENSKQKLLDLTEQEEMIKYFEKMPEIMYKSWLAKRTREEKKYSAVKSNQENLENIKKRFKPKFIVQHIS